MAYGKNILPIFNEKMDIDEFLEREIQAKKKEDEGEKKNAVDKPASTAIPKEDISKESGDIRHFFELWNRVSEAKFKWDNTLYTDTNKAAEKVNAQLNSVLEAMGREKSAVKRLIGKALSEIENKNYENATKLYAEISDMRNNFPEFLLEEKKELNREIFLLYEKLHDGIDLKFIEDFKASITKITKLIKDSISSFDSGDVEKAKALYEKALEEYKNLPNGFLQQKIELGNSLIRLYKDLSIQTQIKELQQQLSTTNVGYSYLGNDNKLMQLAEIIKNKNKANEGDYFSQSQTDISFKQEPVSDKTLLSQLITRKLERARINIQKELYPEAKRNIDAVLRVDPDNIDARQLLRRIPIQV